MCTVSALNSAENKSTRTLPTGMGTAEVSSILDLKHLEQTQGSQAMKGEVEH